MNVIGSILRRLVCAILYHCAYFLNTNYFESMSIIMQFPKHFDKSSFDEFVQFLKLVLPIVNY